jgi:hypothetical protein
MATYANQMYFRVSPRDYRAAGPVVQIGMSREQISLYFKGQVATVKTRGGYLLFCPCAVR